LLTKILEYEKDVYGDAPFGRYRVNVCANAAAVDTNNREWFNNKLVDYDAAYNNTALYNPTKHIAANNHSA